MSSEAHSNGNGVKTDVTDITDVTEIHEKNGDGAIREKNGNARYFPVENVVVTSTSPNNHVVIPPVNCRALSGPLDESRVQRPLAAFEEIMDTFHHVGNYMFVVGTFLKSRLILEEYHVRETLRELQRRHPLLRMCIGCRDNGQRYFQDMEDLYLDVEVLDYDNWEDCYENMLCTRFDVKKGPLWRAKLLLMPATNADCKPDTTDHHPYSFTMLFCFHHAIADGICCAYVIKQFVAILTSRLKKDRDKSVNISDSEPLKLLPPLEDLLPPEDVAFGCLGVITLLKLGLKQIGSKVNPYLRKFPPTVSKEQIVEVKTKVIPFELTRSETEKLLSRCKEEKVSVHGALTTAANIAMANIINAKGSISIRSVHPIDARRLIKPDIAPENCGNLVLSVDKSYRVKVTHQEELPQRFWKMAGLVTKATGRAIYFKEHTGLLRVYDRVWNRESYLKNVDGLQSKGGRDGDHAFTLSNLGNLDRILELKDDNPDIKVDNILMATGIHKYGPVFLHNLVTFKGQLRWHLNYCTNVTTTEQATKYSHAIHQTILNILK